MICTGRGSPYSMLTALERVDTLPAAKRSSAKPFEKPERSASILSEGRAEAEEVREEIYRC
eukprot:216066-Prymnesium_polylepis.1